MRGINYVEMGGNVGRDPELQYMTDGTAVAKLSLAVSRRPKGKEHDELMWVPIVCFGALADAVGKNIAKGDSILARGRLRFREYEDREGGRRKVTEVIANEVHFLITKKRDGQQGEQPPDAFDEETPF